ncbi:N-acetylglucosamine-6-phosphate deacetylase [Brevundimonas sp. Leaf363]|uniref:N-acetylglucosamine-6-phosphate deacetylase n=1 Tax=Brevundimonas sp. Leaf363 TaxID=1736353 RepID=UPI0012E2C684|nr:N-acetylglucosamine-6-phosphate deacetylase [Brevundimonas sp. Leaf363]
MMQALVNGRIVVDGELREGLSVVLDGDRIAAVTNAPPLDAEVYDLEGRVLAPGYIDVQVNGGGGVLFNDDPSVETVATIAAAHRRFGTTGLLPTLISDDLDVIAAAIAATDAAIKAGVPGILGVHIEGPFLNMDRRGVHDATKIRRLDDAALGVLSSARHGRTLVTLAPETTTPEMTRALAARGVRICAGHTDADYETLKAAFSNGVTGVTHLFNAMSPMTSRAPGAVGAALENQDAWCGIIPDGWHVDPAVLRIALACRPHDRFMLVTDAMPGVGSPEDHFMLQGRRVTVADGQARLPDGSLAGSDLDMAGAVRNAVAWLNLTLPQAVEMASASPAAFLGLEAQTGRIAPGLRADLVELNSDLSVRRSWIAGRAS